MSKTQILLRHFALLGLVAARPSASAQEPVALEPAPQIHCEAPVFEFGDADNSTTVEHEFTLENRGTARLTISDVRADCGCTVARLSQKEIDPGGSAALSARLNLKGRTGRQVKSIHIFSDDPARPTFSVTLEGNATSLVSIEPARIQARGSGTEPLLAHTVTVKSAISHPLRITQVDAGHPQVTAEWTESVPDFEYRIVLTPAESLPGGQVQGLLRIFTDSERYPELSVPYMFLRATGDFIVAPEELVLPLSDDAQPLVRQFVVRPGLVTEFQVTRVGVPDERIESDVVKIADGYLIRLRNLIPGPELDGTRVVVETDAEGAKPVELPLRVVRPSAPPASF